MWNRLSIRVKLTLLTAIVLCIISLISFRINIDNASNIFIIPDGVNVTNTMGGRCFKLDFDIAQKTFRINCFYITVFCSVFGTALMWFVSGRVLKPLSTFTKAIKDIDINNVGENVSVVKSKDEVGELQDSFNFMLENIKDSYIRQKSFSQNAAHELKTPVAAIKTNLEVLNMDENPDISDYKDFVNVVSRQIDMMSSIVQGLRLLSSGESLNFEKICLKDLIYDILTDLKTYIESRHQKVEVLFDNTDFNIQADRVLLKQAVFNIVHNAIRYSPDEAIIKITQTGDVLSIKNFGTGIAQADLNRVFEPFYCIDKSRSKKYGGSGLGLAIAKDIADRHGFTINAKSKVDEYVEISISFSENKNE
jgi:ATPase/histidine kinase/DNA gyrase B/HSP90 domain protein